MIGLSDRQLAIVMEAAKAAAQCWHRVIEKNVRGTVRLLSYKNRPRPECNGLHGGP